MERDFNNLNLGESLPKNSPLRKLRNRAIPKPPPPAPRVPEPVRVENIPANSSNSSNSSSNAASNSSSSVIIPTTIESMSTLSVYTTASSNLQLSSANSNSSASFNFNLDSSNITSNTGDRPISSSLMVNQKKPSLYLYKIYSLKLITKN